MEPTHAYVAFCSHCGGINGAFVDDDWDGLSDHLRAWAREKRRFERVLLPVQLSCSCVPDEPMKQLKFAEFE